MITRTATKQLKINKTILGGQNKVLIQSMTNTKTHDVQATLNQIKELKLAGADLVRLAVFDDKDKDALAQIIQQTPVDLIADIHFNFEYAIAAINAGFKKIRLNPGNLNDPEKVKTIAELAKKNNVVIRVGVNSGSIPIDLVNKYGVSAKAMIEAAKRYVQLLNQHGFDDIVISLKASDPLLMMQAYELAADTFVYPLHLGVTEAGVGDDGIIKSVVGLTPLLLKGIGDTIRISLTGNPVHEVYVAKKLLNTLKLRHDLVDIVSCPTCGRLDYDMFSVVDEIKEFVKPLNFPLKVSILGCVVNGIGEGKEADIGIAGSKKSGIIFKKGKILKTVKEEELVPELKKLILEAYNEYKEQEKK